MTKKNDKRLCWNCDGSVSLHVGHCPYCGMDLTKVPQQEGEKAHFQELASPFQSAASLDDTVPQPPFANIFNQENAITEDEWNQSFMEKTDSNQQEDEDLSTTTKREMVALLLLLPGIVFFLFGLALVFFSSEGVLSLEWNQNFAIFYCLGAVPLLYLGWRALR